MAPDLGISLPNTVSTGLSTKCAMCLPSSSVPGNQAALCCTCNKRNSRQEILCLKSGQRQHHRAYVRIHECDCSGTLSRGRVLSVQGIIMLPCRGWKWAKSTLFSANSCRCMRTSRALPPPTRTREQVTGFGGGGGGGQDDTGAISARRQGTAGHHRDSSPPPLSLLHRASAIINGTRTCGCHGTPCGQSQCLGCEGAGRAAGGARRRCRR